MLGTQLLHYQIDAHLGTGGMGEVYRARDTRLGRSVAIKVLPQVFAQDVERVARFEREARLLASLNHANIAALHGFETFEGRHFLVMELVEGETLGQRIQSGRVPVEEALGIARQICEALEAAHDKGVVHRDLKPANVKITPEGKVKVLDFGLAKAVEEGAQANLLNSPTLSIAATHAGVIMGTAAYMSPEQAKGVATDHRSDIFSFGCVLYEMLTGRQSFQGDTMTEVIASVLKTDPDVTLLPPNLHPRLVDVVRRCLVKDPKRRWHAIADVRVEIESILADPRGLTPRIADAVDARPLWRRALPLAGAAVIGASLAGAAAWLVRPVPAAPVSRFSIVLPDGQRLTRTGRHNVAVSPDGQTIAYVADLQLYLRGMADIEPRPLPGTNQDINTPFFSPDGQWIGYFSVPEGKLKKIAITGGASIPLAEVTNPFGAAWHDDGFILVGQGPRGIVRVPANGGAPELLIKAGTNEVLHGPHLLPGGDRVLFTVAKGSGGTSRWDEAQIVTQSLSSGERTVLIGGGSDARYMPTGHIVYALGVNLLAVPFDVDTNALDGGPVPVVERVFRSGATNTAAAFFSVADNGTLVHFVSDRTLEATQLAVVDLKGVATPIPLPPGVYGEPRISPDGTQFVVRVDSEDGESNLWIHHLDGTGAPRRLTFGGSNSHPAWTHDGRRIAFVSNRDGMRVYWQPADGSGVAESLTGTDEQPTGDVFAAADGSMLLFREVRGGGDVRMLPLTGDRKARGALQAEGNQFQASLSPDGRWIAYASIGSGVTVRVYVQPFPPTGAPYQISSTAGRSPLWSADGTRLYFAGLEADSGKIFAVPVQTQPAFAFGVPVPVANGVAFQGSAWPYSVMRDGRLLIATLPNGEASQDANPEIGVTLNWLEELKRRVPVN